MPTTTRLEIQPIAGALGAELHGVDLGADLDDATIAEIRQALLDHCVIFFRDQDFDAARHKATHMQRDRDDRGPRETETVDRTVPLPANGTVRLKTFSGRVRITGTSGELVQQQDRLHALIGV